MRPQAGVDRLKPVLRKPSLWRNSHVICGWNKTMTQTGEAKVEWNPEKKHWQVVIQAGAEVIRRQRAKPPQDAGDAELRTRAIPRARGEGYTMEEAQVSIVRCGDRCDLRGCAQCRYALVLMPRFKT